MTRPRKPFPLYLTILLALFLGFLGWSYRQAASDGARITDHDYYSKGLRYNSSELEMRAAATLGWQVNVKLIDHTLNLHLQDRLAQPISQAHIELQLLLTDHRQTLLLKEQDAGRYQGRLPETLRGEIPARYVIVYDGAHLERNLLIHLQD
mgnify:CR=1 FL=1